MRRRMFALLALLFASALAGCAGSIPSVSSGTSTPSFGAPGDMPQRISIQSRGIQNYDPVGDVLRAELPALGFTIVQADAEATFEVILKFSDFSPVHLALTLRDVESGRILWHAEIVRKWDMYASVVSASQSNARKAMDYFRRDLAAAGVRR